MANLAEIQKEIEAGLINAGVESVLPEHIKMSTFIRCAAIALSQSKDLEEADRDSVIMSLTKCANDGLIPDNKEAALVTFKTNVGTKQQPNWVKKAQYLPMIDGVLKRARMSGQITTMSAKAVFDGDDFDYWLDEDGEHIKYRPNLNSRGEFKLAFAMAKLVSGDLIVEVMTQDDIDKVRAASKTGEYGPWKDWYDRMACKAVFHRLARRLPNASEIVEMCQAGLDVEFGRTSERDITPKRPQIAHYPQEDFDKNLPTWKGIIESGKRSLDEVIATIECKGLLSEAQKQKLKKIG